MTFQPSPQQAAVGEVMLRTQENICVSAVAGSGKTSTLVWLLSLLPTADPETFMPPAVTFLAFNKSIAETLRSRCPRHVQCSTFHSLGLRALKTVATGQPKVEGRKVSRLVWDACGRDNPDIQPIIRLVGLLKGQWPTVGEASRVDALCARHELDFDNPRKAHAIALQVLAASDRNLGEVDFDDMLRLPLLRSARFEPQDWVFVDECQDLNSVQQEMLSRLAKPVARSAKVAEPEILHEFDDEGNERFRVLDNETISELRSAESPTRFIFVGDPKQAIYGFRGADSASMQRLSERFACRQMPLSVSFRCPKAVVLEAQKYFK